MSGFKPEVIRQQMLNARWSALNRTGLDLASAGRIDPALQRDSRVLVPMDVQALYVPPGHTEPTARLRLALAGPEGGEPPPSTGILEDDAPRESGVHLHWAMPDALLRGALGDHGDTNRLKLPPLPDRFVVLRLLVPRGQRAPQVRGWVIEADTARVVPLAQWPAGAAVVAPSARAVPADQLTGSCGGSLNWTGVYDATLNRFALHDPLDDLPALAPLGVEGDQASYLVAGWWSNAARDPLDGVQTDSSLHERLRVLRWAVMEDREGADAAARQRAVQLGKQAAFGLPVKARYAAQPMAATANTRAPARVLPTVGVKQVLSSQVASLFADAAASAVHAEPSWPRSSLLHGSVYGVPVAPLAPAAMADNRPAPDAVDLTWGAHDHDVAATLAASTLVTAPTVNTAAAERRGYERLLAAFTGSLIDRIDTGDGVADAEEWEHAAGFTSQPGGNRGVDRLLDGGDSAMLGAGRHARAAAAARQRSATEGAGTRLDFAAQRKGLKVYGKKESQREDMTRWGEDTDARNRRQDGERPAQAPAAQAREVTRSAPRWFAPAEPMVAVRGAGRSLRHGHDGRMSQDGKLRCRYPSQVIHAIDQVLEGAELLPSLGTAALPDEVLLLAREALLHNPYLTDWLAATATALRGGDGPAVRRRMVAESALRFGSTEAVYDGTSGAFSRKVKTAGQRTRTLTDDRIADQLRRFSLVRGIDPDPVAITAWSQPWVPLWLEWELTLTLADRLDAWRLGSVDLEPAPESALPAGAPITRVFRGRSVLTCSTGITLASAIREWLDAENLRDKDNRGEASESTETMLGNLAAAISQLDLVSASLDGVREQLAGLAYHGGLIRERDASGTFGPPNRSGLDAVWLAGGMAQLSRARLVDAFGRVLVLPVAQAKVPQRRTVPGLAAALALPPRLTAPARLMLRLIDPAADAGGAAEATVDQVEPARMVNPVAGFVLPDHIDESLEFFNVAGEPIGQLLHEPIGGGVMWETAPGRPGPADAGPLFGLAGAARHLGWLAAGAVAADVKARNAGTLPAGADSALSALLRAIDTTMWSVDALKGLGTEHIAGLVGRPMALVRARLSLELLGEHGLDAASIGTALADRAFRVRLGEFTRSDDSVLAYFVDDDYDHVHVVDKVVAQLARDSGRLRGQLGSYGPHAQVPGLRRIDHPYVLAEDEVLLRPGQSLVLTLLMHPAGKAHATCGVLPRKSIQLARDWVAPGLAVMAPSARVGPVLIDPAQVRLPRISAFPKDQLFTRRDTPGTWRDDPILAATQEALLPDLPHEVQEGYIRIAPTPPQVTGSAGGSTPPTSGGR